MCCMWLAENTGCKKSPSGHHHTTFAGSIFTTQARIDNREKKLVKQQYLLQMSPQYGELRSTSSWDRFISLWHPCKFQWVSRLGSVTAQHSSIGRQPNFAALNRGRHLYSAGRPSRWAHISSMTCFSMCMCEPGSFLLLVWNLTSPSCPWTSISYKMCEFCNSAINKGYIAYFAIFLLLVWNDFTIMFLNPNFLCDVWIPAIRDYLRQKLAYLCLRGFSGPFDPNGSFRSKIGDVGPQWARFWRFLPLYHFWQKPIKRQSVDRQTDTHCDTDTEFIIYPVLCL